MVYQTKKWRWKPRAHLLGKRGVQLPSKEVVRLLLIRTPTRIINLCCLLLDLALELHAGPWPTIYITSTYFDHMVVLCYTYNYNTFSAYRSRGTDLILPVLFSPLPGLSFIPSPENVWVGYACFTEVVLSSLTLFLTVQEKQRAITYTAR